MSDITFPCPVCGQDGHSTIRILGRDVIVCPEVKVRTGCDIFTLTVGAGFTQLSDGTAGFTQLSDGTIVISPNGVDGR